MFFSMIVVHCNSGIRQVVLDFFVLIDEHRIHDCEGHRMPLFLDTFPPGTNPDWMMECKSWELPT